MKNDSLKEGLGIPRGFFQRSRAIFLGCLVGISKMNIPDCARDFLRSGYGFLPTWGYGYRVETSTRNRRLVTRRNDDVYCRRSFDSRRYRTYRPAEIYNSTGDPVYPVPLTFIKSFIERVILGSRRYSSRCYSTRGYGTFRWEKVERKWRERNTVHFAITRFVSSLLRNKLFIIRGL